MSRLEGTDAYARVLLHWTQGGQSAASALSEVAKGDDAKAREVASELGLPVRDLIEITESIYPKAYVAHLAQLVQARTASSPEPHDLAARWSLLSGQESSEELERASIRMDGQSVELLPMKARGSAPGPHEEPLDERLTRLAVQVRTAHVLGLLAGACAGESISPAQIGERAQARLAATKNSKTEVDPHVKELLRLLHTQDQGYEAKLDRARDRVTLCERTTPLPPQVAARIDRAQNARLFAELVTDLTGQEGGVQVGLLLAERLPTEVLRLVKSAGLREIALLENALPLAPRAQRAMGRANLGLSLTTWLVAGVDYALGLGGVAMGTAGLVALGASAALDSPTVANGILRGWYRGRVTTPAQESGVMGMVKPYERSLQAAWMRHAGPETSANMLGHELMHVVDFALGAAGPLSAEPEFAELYARTQGAANEGLRYGAFPTRYSATSPAELFAEAAVVFLDVHVKLRGENGRAETRGALFERHPELYAYFERLFAERLPAALERGGVCSADEWVVVGDLEKARASAPETRDVQDWITLSAAALARARETRDPAALEEAKAAGAQARAGVPFVFAGYLRENVRRLERRVIAVAAELAHPSESS